MRSFKTEHCGPKKGWGAYQGDKRNAKEHSRKERRRVSKLEVRGRAPR